MTDQITDTLKNTSPALLAGIIGATAGGGLTLASKRPRRETRSAYIARILKNALMTGGLAAGGAALLDKGMRSTVGSTNVAAPLAGDKGNEGPLPPLVKNLLYSPMASMVGAGGSVYGLSGLRGMGAAQNKASDAFHSQLKRSLTDWADNTSDVHALEERASLLNPNRKSGVADYDALTKLKEWAAGHDVAADLDAKAAELNPNRVVAHSGALDDLRAEIAAIVDAKGKDHLTGLRKEIGQAVKHKLDPSVLSVMDPDQMHTLTKDLQIAGGQSLDALRRRAGIRSSGSPLARVRTTLAHNPMTRALGKTPGALAVTGALAAGGWLLPSTVASILTNDTRQ